MKDLQEKYLQQSWIHTVLSSLREMYPTVEYTFETFEVGHLSRYNEGKTCGGATQGVKFTRCSASRMSIPASSTTSQSICVGTEIYAPCMEWKKSALVN